MDLPAPAPRVKRKAPFLNDWRRFLLLSSFPVVLGTFAIGLWVSTKIERGVVHQVGSFTGLSVSSIVSPWVDSGDTPLTAEASAVFDQTFVRGGWSIHLARVQIWGRNQQLLYSTDSQMREVPASGLDLEKAFRGWVNAEMVTDAEGQRWLHALGPVRSPESQGVLAVVEFYQKAEQFDAKLGEARQTSWLVVGLAMLVVYLFLGILVRPSFSTIAAQQKRLEEQVFDLQTLLAQNKALGQRVRDASRRAATTTERFFRRLGAELHDGPAQDISLALLRWETLEDGMKEPGVAETARIRGALENALRDIRTLSAGLSLPELDNLTLSQAVAKAVRAHERRSGTEVQLEDRLGTLEAPAALKIVVYRVIQEALNNAYRHAGGLRQAVQLSMCGQELKLVVSNGIVSDRTSTPFTETDDHLGVAGMRERVESLGGVFALVPSAESVVVQVSLPLETPEEHS